MPKAFPHPRVKRPTRTPIRKSLERAARNVKDTDEFVVHVAAICARYREAQGQNSSAGRNATKRALRQFRKHATSLVNWFALAEGQRRATAEAEALAQLGQVLHGGRGFVQVESEGIREWLARAERAVEQVLTRPRSSSVAPSVAAEALLATFDYHNLKATVGTQRQPGTAVLLMKEIASAAGDSLTTDAARAALRNAKAPPRTSEKAER